MKLYRKRAFYGLLKAFIYKKLMIFYVRKLSYLYKQLNNEDYYKKYLEKAKEIKSIDDIDFWNVKLLNTSITDDQYKFLLKFDFDLFYLSYWHFDISQIQ